MRVCVLVCTCESAKFTKYFENTGVAEGELCVFFRNNHFCTMCKFDVLLIISIQYYVCIYICIWMSIYMYIYIYIYMRVCAGP